MCDLKRTLDAEVYTMLSFIWSEVKRVSVGSLRPRNAVGNWEDRLVAVLNRFIPTGAGLAEPAYSLS